MLTIENKTTQDDKELMFMLLQHIYRAMKGKPHNIKGFLNQIESEATKAKIMRMLQLYKIAFK